MQSCGIYGSVGRDAQHKNKKDSLCFKITLVMSRTRLSLCLPVRVSLKSVKMGKLLTVSLTRPISKLAELRTSYGWFLGAYLQWPCHSLGRSPQTLWNPHRKSKK